LLETRKMVGSAGLIYSLYDKMQTAAQDWDGQRPLRRLDELL